MSSLTADERRALLEDLNCADLGEIRSYCDRHPMEQWVAGHAPTVRELAAAWIGATTGGRDMLHDEYAYLSDLRRGAVDEGWKDVRAARAACAIAVLDRLDAQR